MNNNLKIHFLNTIWSDSIILEANKHYAFVDTASKFYYPMIKDYTAKLGIKKIDFILLTHFHSDHYGNLAEMLNDYKVDKLYLKHYSAKEVDSGGGKPTTEEYLNHEKAMFNEIIESAKKNNVKLIFLDDLEDKTEPYIIDFEANLLKLYNLCNNLNDMYNDSASVYYHTPSFSENVNSIFLYVCANGKHVLLGSDLTDSTSEDIRSNRLSEEFIKKIYEDEKIDYIDVFKSCHHGGGGSNRLDMCHLLKAKYVIITNTDNYLVNWPTLENFKDANKDVEIFQTDYFQYVFEFKSDKIEIEKIPLTSIFIDLHKK